MNRGVSPVIATTILIVITMTLSAIIFTVSKGFITQLSPPANCDRIVFKAGVYQELDGSITFEIENIGTEIIEQVDLALRDDTHGTIDTQIVNIKIDPGKSNRQSLTFTQLPTEIIVTPYSKNRKGEIKACDESYTQTTQVIITPGSSETVTR